MSRRLARAYGNEWVVTPNLDRLAAESVVFDRHISDSPEPVAACRAWVGESLPSGSRLTESLRAAGVATVLVRANHPDTDAPDWYYAGWDEVFDVRPQEEDKSPLDALVRGLPSVLDRLSATPDSLLWIEIDRLLPPWEIRQEVFEAYLEHEAEEQPEADEEEADEEETDEDEADEEEEAGQEEGDDEVEESLESDEPVTPWRDPPTGPFDASDPDAREWLASSFGALLSILDNELGALFELLRARGLDQSATWLLTSDFGYPLGDHGQIGLHRPWPYLELVHLPPIPRPVPAAEACRRVFGFTQPPDVLVTLLDLFGVKPPGGTSLLPLARGEAVSARNCAITALELGDAAERAIRTDDWAYLVPVRVPEGEKREPQLFQKPDDRWEVNDLRSQNIERADELEQILRDEKLA